MRGRMPTQWLVLPIALTLLAACGPTDPAIQVAVDSRLAADRATADLSLDIAVTRGVVRLEGEVDSMDQRRQALAVARAVPGVAKVVDGMFRTDAAILAAVKDALAVDTLVGRIPIAVNVQHGNVELTSDQTGKEDRARAVGIAMAVDGVKQVRDLMR